jgi:NADH-quinone oxidoreductase subunit J
MILQALTFYVFAAITVVSGCMVVASRNPVHSVLFLILSFFTSAGLFVLIGAEFLAMILVIVYVGAVAVLFLFVVMMLDINFVELRAGFLHYLPIGATVGAILLVELLLVLAGAEIAPAQTAAAGLPTAGFAGMTNTHAIGQVLYTRYLYMFQAAGMLLLVAMVGAIVLTLRQRPGVRRQSIHRQNTRRREDSVEIRKVQPGQGI